MKDYYELLEISRHASSEIIEKAYKTLAKKYHPDVQPPEKKAWAEKKFKEINEAYELLSNKDKKYSYDESLLNEEKLKDQNKTSSSTINTEPKKNSSAVTNNNIPPKETVTSTPKENPSYHNSKKNIENTINKAYHDAYNKAYHDAYIDSLKQLGYRIRYKKSFSSYIKNFIAIILTFLVLSVFAIIAWKIPYFHDKIISNEIISFIIEFFKNLYLSFTNV